MRKILITSVLSLLVSLVWGQSYSYRYWTDHDVGSAVNGSGTGETQFILHTTSLSSGLHTLHVQARNAAGLWSSVRTRYFCVAKDANQVSSARYWLDNDMSTMHNNVATSGEIEIDLSQVGVGLHTIHYQKIATDGTPSSAYARYFFVAKDANQISSARYWIDNDTTNMHNNVATSGIIDLDISKLGAGLHSVHYQKIAADGTPSSVRTRYFVLAPKQTDNLTAAIGIDDGEKTLYPLTGEDIVIDLGELKGEHVLHVALYDNLNRLIGEQTQTFMAAPVEVLTVETAEAGTLANFIANADRYTLKELTITGPLNSTDFKLLREMAGNNYLGEATAGKLQILDLSGATIVTGGEYYYETGQLAIAKDNELGEGIFKDCNLTKIVLPGNLTAIGPYAFEGCQALTDVTSYIKKPFDIARNNFCLTRDGDFTSATLTVPYNTKASYQQADGWKYFSTIVEMSAADTNIDFADNKVKTVCVGHWDTNGDGELSYAEAADVTTLGTAFKGTGIETFDELIYFTGLTNISDYAFQGCSGLTSIIIPEGVTSIGQQAFDCSNLTTVIALGTNPPTITANTFTNSANATLYVPSADSKDLYMVADYWKDFGRITYDGEPEPPQVIDFADATTKTYCVYYWDANGDDELDVNEAAAVTAISDEFLQSDITSFDELRYFTGLVSIDEMAFALCEQLESITIPRAVTTVGGGLFYYCNALTSVKVDEENAVLDSRNGCNAIIKTATNTLLAGCKTTVIPDDVTAIGESAFYHIHGLTDLTLPQGLKTIDDAALFGVLDQESLVIPQSVTSIGFEAFGNMNALESLVVEQGNTVYDSRGGCNAVIETATNNLIAGCKTTVIPNTVTSIDICAFDVCPITELNIPASVTSIDEYAVRLCSSLSTIKVASGNTVYDSHGNCNAIIETATGKLLLGCPSTVIPMGTKSIGNYAFYGYENLESIEIPGSVTAIGDHAFARCDNLLTVIAAMKEPMPIAENTFTSRFNATLYVPIGSKSLYMAAEYWKDFYDIEEIDMGGLDIVPTDISTLPNAIYAHAATGLKGGETTLTICLKNEQATNAYSFDLKLPDGVTATSYTLSNRHDGHSASVNYNETKDVYSFAVLSLGSKELKDNDGAILTVILNVDDNMTIGNYAVKIQNAKYSLPSGSSKVTMPETISLLSIEDYLKGDVNGDGEVDIADAVCIVNHVVGKATPAFVAAAADVNGDGDVDIADAVRIVNLVVGKIDALARRFEWNLPEPQ